MEKNEVTYTIQQVSDITGLSKQLIRKWEDRYGLIQPERLDNGYRVYTQVEIDLLTKMLQLIDKGHSAKHAANMILKMQAAVIERPAPSSNVRSAHYVDLLVEYGAVGNDVQIMHTLQQAQHLLGVEVLLDEVIVPFLKKVGDYWCDNVWGEYQEAMSSLTVRDFLGNLRRSIYVDRNAPLILGSCIVGERHELPMQILLVKCTLYGYRTVMLGPAPAPKAIETAVLNAQPKIVLLSSTTKDAYIPHLAEIEALDHFAAAHTDTKFFIGGAGAATLLNRQVLQHIKSAHTLDDVFGE